VYGGGIALIRIPDSGFPILVGIISRQSALIASQGHNRFTVDMDIGDSGWNEYEFFHVPCHPASAPLMKIEEFLEMWELTNKGDEFPLPEVHPRGEEFILFGEEAELMFPKMETTGE